MTTATIDYGPVLDGLPYDPEPDGGGVDRLRLYTDEERATVPVVDVGPAERTAPGRYRFAFEQPADGTYFAAIDWRETADADPFTDANETLTFPLATAPEPVLPGHVVTLAEVARRAGFPLPMTLAQREVLIDAIEDAQSDVEAYLGQPITPTEHTDTGLYSHGTEWAVTRRPLVKIETVEAEKALDDSLLGTFAVTYLYGLDAANADALRPIRRYVAAHAAALARQSPITLSFKIARGIKSLSVEGQSVTFETGVGVANTANAGSGEIGTLPVLASLSRWKRRGVFQRSGTSDRPRSTFA
jgi:hypothetical protein